MRTLPTPSCSSTTRPTTCRPPPYNESWTLHAPTRRAGFTVELGGAPIATVEKAKFGASEGVGILAAIIILLLVFGSFIAMGLPILTALFGIAIAFGVLNFLSHAFIVPTFGGELAALIGLGAGIDYALFITTRYRQGLHDGMTHAMRSVPR